MEREHAFNALDRALREEGYLKEFLSGASPLAFEIACGVMRQKRNLEELLYHLNPQRLKRKEKIVLFIALYEHLYLRTPPHALVNEAVSLAKKKCHATFARFCNAFLRKLPPREEVMPKTLSYPDTLLERIDPKYLRLMDRPPAHFARDRISGACVRIERPLDYAADSRWYIQNPTPWELLKTPEVSPPERILDLCAAPGGKTLALHDLFPNAAITSNDASEKRLTLLCENREKYGIPCEITCHDGTAFPSEVLYDLVVVDAPCSNSGVLGKRPEARWRFSEESLAELNALQRALVTRALSLVRDGGEVWYMTCSILPEENEEIAEPFSPKMMRTLYPDEEGRDGGFIAQLKKTVS